ncbi:ABC transporter permease [Cucumibacter marinus]|uniref:ABC transporter permease n=1 Tax=Cucumibacter marinus TaxID=1121252 RepID=UPI0003FD37D5|nr:ABC transporter permease [Cucumibacter marinus]
MLIKLEKRPTPSRRMLYITPVLAVIVTMALGAIIFSLIGFDGLRAVREIFLTPLLNPLKWQDLAVKASPLIIIAVGLSIGYRGNVWNIGAEGQYVLGGLAATGVALWTHQMSGPWILPLMGLAGILGGMAWAVIPAFLRTRYKVNEILTTLMLTYVSVYLLNFLVFGPWKSPTSFGQPQTVRFSADQSLPDIIPGTIVHGGTLVAVVVAVLAWFVMSRTIFGYQVKTVGTAPAAARYGGFSGNRTIWLVLMTSAGLAGLAGMLEVSGPYGRMVPQFPVNYGFTAIIVAFLGRLHPIGIVFAGLVLSIVVVGGEVAQTTIGLPFPAVGIFQSMMLFFLLASDVLVRYRVRRVNTSPPAAPAPARTEAAPDAGAAS